MLDADERSELRALQARAYGRAGGLDERDAARLDELLVRRTGGDDPADASPRAEDGDSDGLEPGAAASDGDPDNIAAPVPPARPSLRAALRSHALAFSIGAVVVLGLGAGAGWLLDQQPSRTAIALDPEQQEWQDAMVAQEDFDAGSVRAAGIEADTVIWVATKQQGEWTCLVIGTGENVNPVCNPTESVESMGLYAATEVEVDDQLTRQISAQLFLTLDGDPAISSYSYVFAPSDNGTTYANEREVEIAEGLAAQGYDSGSIQIIGYDGDTPIWTARETGTGDSCLIISGEDAAQGTACDDVDNLAKPGATLAMAIFDGESGTSTRYEYSVSGAPHLVITHDSGTGMSGG
jgi:hypothetical protein